MALKLTAAVRNYIMQGGSLKSAFANSVMKWYSGAQPATAETTPSGTLAATISNGAGAVTREVYSVGSVVLTGGASGSVNTLTVNGLEIMGSATAFNTSLIQTATDIVTKINNNPQNMLFTASNVAGTSATITLTAKPGLGALANAWAVVASPTTITVTNNNMAGGVTAVNGLTWGASAAGVLVKNPTQTWSGAAILTATVGWFRIEAAVVDALGTDASEAVMRIDGSVGVSGAELNMGSTTVTSGVLQTVNSFALTMPTD